MYLYCDYIKYPNNYKMDKIDVLWYLILFKYRLSGQSKRWKKPEKSWSMNAISSKGIEAERLLFDRWMKYFFLKNDGNHWENQISDYPE